MKCKYDDSLVLRSVKIEAISVFVDPLDGTFQFVLGNLAKFQTLAGLLASFSSDSWCDFTLFRAWV